MAKAINCPFLTKVILYSYSVTCIITSYLAKRKKGMTVVCPPRDNPVDPPVHCSRLVIARTIGY